VTAAGRRLAAFAADGSRRSDEFLRDLHDRPPTLTVAAGRGAFRWVIGDAIRCVTAEGRRVRVIAADRDSAVAALATGDADVAVVGYDPPPRQVESVQIGAYPQVLVIDSAHQLAGRARLRLPDLAGLDLVVPPPERAHRKALERALLDADVAWQPAAEADGWDLLIHFTALGIGATIVNGCVQVPDGLTAVPVIDLPVVRYWMAWRRHTRPPDILRRPSHRYRRHVPTRPHLLPGRQRRMAHHPCATTMDQLIPATWTTTQLESPANPTTGDECASARVEKTHRTRCRRPVAWRRDPCRHACFGGWSLGGPGLSGRRSGACRAAR
jgi:hypothetical protein